MSQILRIEYNFKVLKVLFKGKYLNSDLVRLMQVQMPLLTNKFYKIFKMASLGNKN